MIRRSNGCVACPRDAIGCNHTMCDYAEQVDYICDGCGESVEQLYWVDGYQLCGDCVLRQFDQVEEDDDDL